MTAVMPPNVEPQSGDTRSPADAYAQRMFQALLGTLDIMSVYLGDKAGWYRSLAEAGPATPTELAARTGTDERYAREWLEQQAVTSLLDVLPGEPRRFAMGPAATEVLTDESSLNYLAPVVRMFGSVTEQLPALLEAYRRGGGVGWAQFGAPMRESQAALNRPWYEHLLADAIASVPDLDATLRVPGARIADIGCGGGWSTIALARAYPEATLHGYDIDAPSVELAEHNVAANPEVAARVEVTCTDAAALPDEGFDAAFAFECIHDMPDPVGVLTHMRRALRPGAPMIVMDEAVAEQFAAPGDDLERMMYGFSLTVCLPDGRSHEPSAATGTVMREATLRAYAEAAGFARSEVLPIEDFGFWRFYRLTG